MISNEEDFNLITGTKGMYCINKKGDVFSKKHHGRWKKLKPFIVAGYNAVGISFEEGRRITHIHRILATTYLINPDNKPCVNHIDGNKLNNDLSNLEWSTYSENSIHSFKMGLSTHRGENCHTSKMTSNTAKAIYLLKDQYKQIELSEMFNVSPNAIYKIHNKKSWRKETSTLDLLA